MTALDVSYLGALLAGLLSFVSPCVLPLVPPYLCFLGGVSHQQLESGDAAPARRVFAAALAFVLGFTTVFVALGLTASLIGQAIAEHFRLLSIVAGAIIILLGLHFLGVWRIALFYREARFQTAARPASLLGAYVVGLAFAFGWTPCVGPVLSSILLIAGDTRSAWSGGSLLAVYSLGIGVPFLAAAAAAPWFMRLMRRFRTAMRHVERVMGGFLIMIGVLLMTGAFREIGNWLYDTFPFFQRIG